MIKHAQISHVHYQLLKLWCQFEFVHFVLCRSLSSPITAHITLGHPYIVVQWQIIAIGLFLQRTIFERPPQDHIKRSHLLY